MSKRNLPQYVKFTGAGLGIFNSDCMIENVYGEIVFLSAFGYSSNIYALSKTFKEGKATSMTYDGTSCTLRGRYNIITKKAEDSDYMHLIAYAKDNYRVNSNNEETFVSHIFYNSQEEIIEKIYEVLTKYSSIPVLKEWMPYLESEITQSSNMYQELLTYQYNATTNTPDLFCAKFICSRDTLLELIQNGLKNDYICIGGTSKESQALKACNGIDSYLRMFGEGLAKKIQQSFKPKFIPGEDKYDNYLVNIDDYVYYNANVDLYEAQRSTIQSIVNNMKAQDNTLLVGEMGSGKTLMASTACYVHNANKNKGFNALVMCPSHLVENWKNEVTRFIPNGRVYIIHNLEELLEIENRLRDKHKVENTFVVLSKESAKIGFGSRPAAIYKPISKYKNKDGRQIIARNVFVCPECGQVLTKVVKTAEYPGSRRKIEKIVPLELTDFTSENELNIKCNNSIEYYNTKEEAWMTKSCNAKIWTANNRDDDDINWVKLGKEGWVHAKTIEILMDRYMSSDLELSKKETDFFIALTTQYNNIKTQGHTVHKFKGTKKYPIAKYIKNRMSHVFDYGIFDESQNYKGKTEQGHAFHILSQSCKKTINCTGTLMNGYVSSMYYLLYRLFPNTMQKEGFSYKDEAEFNRIFGVYSTSRTSVRGRVKTGATKLLPGISSLVFTKFLLNNTVFVSLEDMTEGLPNYTEIPYSIKMDEQTEEVYQNYENFLANTIRNNNNNNGNKKYVRQFCKHMLTLPDAPHCLQDEINEEQELLFSAPDIQEFETNKDKALLDIVNAKVSAGEKVLIYYNDVGTTNLGDHIRLYLNGYGFKAHELKASVKAEKREQYINNLIDNKANVVICNPTLVETGLNLLDFTTIIFYQLGYNLNTMRQASRRSWRLSQSKDISVYFLYYQDTTQEATLSLMATKLHAAQSMEGKFSEEGLRAMSDNQDVLTQIASNIVDGIKDTVDKSLFSSSSFVKKTANLQKIHARTPQVIQVPIDNRGRRKINTIFHTTRKPNIDSKILQLFK